MTGRGFRRGGRSTFGQVLSWLPRGQTLPEASWRAAVGLMLTSAVLVRVMLRVPLARRGGWPQEQPSL
jgi:hypothetical protein